MRDLEDVLMEAMEMCRERTVNGFGRSPALGPKVDVSVNVAGQALTTVDLENQETILQHLYNHFPDIVISVEERTNNPTPVQAAFYRNDGADILVQLDPLDGTYCYIHGIRPDYGLIASIVERADEKQGRIVSGILYYPSLGFFITANQGQVYKIKENQTERLSKELDSRLEGQYWCTFSHDNRRLELGTEEQIAVPSIYSITQMVLQITHAEIPGFLTANGHLSDHIVGAWMAQQYGCDVEYASGGSLGLIGYGDIITPGSRTTPRDTKGLLIVGTKGDGEFENIRNLHIRYPT